MEPRVRAKHYLSGQGATITGSAVHACPNCQADQDRLSRLITRRTPLQRWREAFHRNADDIKVVAD